MEGYELPREARREIQKKRAEMGENASEEDLRRARRELIQKYAVADGGHAPPGHRAELQEAKVLRAIYSERQLDEVLVDFWLNHFNVYAQKGPLQVPGRASTSATSCARMPGAGSRTCCAATAESPAMLFYLDNWLSTDPNAKGFGRGMMRGRPNGDAGQNRPRGLNENYAREIMELHTLGVDGGYTQKDVTEVARCFTGWTIRGLRQQDPEFALRARASTTTETRSCSARRSRAGGQDEGRPGHPPARHPPRTARFVSTKLARRFVADEPPASLVDRAAETFRRTDGDIREVVRTIVTSPEFLAPAARTAKVKTPLEFVVSAVRASGAEVTDAARPRPAHRRDGHAALPAAAAHRLQGHRRGLGFHERPPRPAQLRARPRGGPCRGRRRRCFPPATGPDSGLAASLAARFVPQGLSEQTTKTLAAESDLTPARVAGLVLGSPEFQRR